MRALGHGAILDCYFTGPAERRSTTISHVGMRLSLIPVMALLLVFLLAVPSKSAEKAAKPDPIRAAIIDKIKNTESLETLIRIAAILDESKPAYRVELAQLTTTKTESVSAPAHGDYTSLIIDARGLDMQRTISPKLLRADGSEVWGTMSVTPDFAIEVGIASFTTGMEDAKQNKRAGSNPLVVKAVGAVPQGAMKMPFISNEDAALILAENARSKFADNCKVIFVVDR